jgi:two-component sensor histidine kinase
MVHAGCKPDGGKSHRDNYTDDSLRVFKYIVEGNKIYAAKSGLQAFASSLAYYDIAWQEAQQNGDTLLLAATLYAKGRAYDAWNKEPLKTIEYFAKASELYKTLPGKYQRYLLVKHLLAHAYEKNNDSLNTIRVLNELYTEILPLPDSIKKQLTIQPQLAAISTAVKNYILAEKILMQLTKREWILNSPENYLYNYLDHYYLTMSQIAVLGYQKNNTPYLDSLEMVFRNNKNLSDSAYYSEKLQQLYTSINNKEKAAKYRLHFLEASYKINDPQGVMAFQKQIDQLQTDALERQVKTEAEMHRTSKIFLGILGVSLILISSLLFFLKKRNVEINKKRAELFVANEELGKKSLQNELLNKELHHRVKNNLQMILSLVYMQERNTSTEEAKDNLQDIRLRIESIANLHRQLMENEAVTDLKKYVSQMVQSVTSLVGQGANVITHLEIESIPLQTGVSFPLGLILNEWITNSVKYAYPTNAMLELYLSIKKNDTHITISYYDSGKPIVASKASKPGLGLNIITLLCSQMEAVLHRDKSNFFDYTLTIPYD